MTQLLNQLIRALPTTTAVLVDYYDKNEQELFTAQLGDDPIGDQPRRLLLPTTDLCTYFLFYKRRDGVTGFDSYAAVASQWRDAVGELRGMAEFTDTSIRLLQTEGTSTGSLERLGEGIGLSVASELHELHQADWRRIPATTERKTLDYWHPFTASDGRSFVQVECKGSGVQDNLKKTPSVSNHKTSIKTKKLKATDRDRKSSILYGTIAVLDDKPQSTARCWLVDPPSGVPDDPVRFKVIARLGYIAELVSFLGGRSSFASALRTRLAALEALPDIAPLTGVPLRTGAGLEFFTNTYSWSDRHPWLQTKSVVADGPVGGQVVALNDRHVLFVGLQPVLLDLAATQDFRRIQDYRLDFGTVRKTLECVVPKARFANQFRDRMPDVKVAEGRDGYVRFVLHGDLHFCQSGFVWGLLPFEGD